MLPRGGCISDTSQECCELMGGLFFAEESCPFTCPAAE